MNKVFFIFLLSISCAFAMSMQEGINYMKQQTNKQILNEFNRDVSLFIQKNNGYIKTAQFEGITGITTTLYPPMIQWNITLDFDSYKKSVIDYIEKNLKNKNPKNYKLAINRINNGEFEKMVKVESNKRAKQYACSRQDYLYIINRGINMTFLHTLSSGAFFNRIEINKDVCKQLGY